MAHEQPCGFEDAVDYPGPRSAGGADHHGRVDRARDTACGDRVLDGCQEHRLLGLFEKGCI